MIMSKSLFARTSVKLGCKAKGELELILEPNMYIFFEKGTGVGVSHLFNRYSDSNKYLNFYDPKQGYKHIMYLDSNYSYAMSKFLPTSGFKWIDLKELDLNKYTSNSSKGSILKVDLDYPKELRELNNDYPLAPD